MCAYNIHFKMSGNNIIRLNVDNSNFTNQPKLVGFDIINSSNFIDNAEDYELYIEKSEIPIPKELPMIVSNEPIRITLEATDKVDKDPVFTGDNLYAYFTIPRQFRNLTEVLKEINNIIYYKLSSTYRWAYLTTSDDEKVTLQVSNANQIGKTKIWIDGLFSSVFKGLQENDGKKIQGVEYFELFPPKPQDGEYTQAVGNIADNYNLKSFRLYSDIPTEPFWLYNQVEGTMVQSSLLGELVFNTRNMVGNVNELYIPNVFRKISLSGQGGIARFAIRVMAYYSNGLELPLTMDKYSYVSITLVFERKNKI